MNIGLGGPAGGGFEGPSLVDGEKAGASWPVIERWMCRSTTQRRRSCCCRGLSYYLPLLVPWRIDRRTTVISRAAAASRFPPVVHTHKDKRGAGCTETGRTTRLVFEKINKL